jgi:hypothetical protein
MIKDILVTEPAIGGSNESLEKENAPIGGDD